MLHHSCTKADDIHGLLVFLDSDPWADRPVLNHCILQPYAQRKPEALRRMRGLLSKFMWRNSKAGVEDEIDIPPCYEHEVRLSLPVVERTVYDDRLAQCQREIKMMKNLRGREGKVRSVGESGEYSVWGGGR